MDVELFNTQAEVQQVLSWQSAKNHVWQAKFSNFVEAHGALGLTHKSLDLCLACCLLCRDINRRSEVVNRVCAILCLTRVNIEALWTFCGRSESVQVISKCCMLGLHESNHWPGIHLQNFDIYTCHDTANSILMFLHHEVCIFAEEVGAVSDVAPEKVANQVEEAGQQAQGQPLLLTRQLHLSVKLQTPVAWFESCWQGPIHCTKVEQKRAHVPKP